MDRSTLDTTAELSIEKLIERMLTASKREHTIMTFSGVKIVADKTEQFVIAVGLGSEAERLLSLISVYNEILQRSDELTEDDIPF